VFEIQTAWGQIALEKLYGMFGTKLIRLGIFENHRKFARQCQEVREICNNRIQERKKYIEKLVKENKEEKIDTSEFGLLDHFLHA